MRLNRAAHVVFLSLAGALIGYSASPQAKSGPTAAPKKERTIQITADGARHNDATGIGSGKNFVIVDGETTVSGEDAKWNQKNRVAEAAGSLKMSDPQADATSKKAIIQYASSKRIVEMVDDVTITVRPKSRSASPSGPAPVSIENGTARVKSAEDDSPRRHPAVITCDRVEYHYARDKKYAKLTGNFKVVHKLKDLTRNVTAKSAEWFGNDDRILLHPPVHFQDTKGQIGDTDQPVTLYTTEGAERIEATKLKLVFPVEDDEEEAPAKPAARPKRP